MPINWPDFSDPLLHRVTVCVRLQEESLLEKYGSTDIEWDARFGDGHWCHLLVDRFGESGDSESELLHFHVDVIRGFGASKPAPSHTIEDIVAEIESFLGKRGKGFLATCLKIPKDHWPTRGIIPAMSGIATESDECTLTLIGARMHIAGCDFDELDWRVDEDGNLLVTLDAFRDVDLDEDLLLTAVGFLREGLDRFVLGPDEAVHVTQE